MSGGAAGDHGIMGIGDGFVPDLIDRSAVDEVVTVTTEEAHAAAERIRREHGYCAGLSAGRITRRPPPPRDRRRRRGVWPDCAPPHGSVSRPPSSKDVRCPLQESCRGEDEGAPGADGPVPAGPRFSRIPARSAPGPPRASSSSIRNRPAGRGSRPESPSTRRRRPRLRPRARSVPDGRPGPGGAARAASDARATGRSRPSARAARGPPLRPLPPRRPSTVPTAPR
jgi:hypothetical protein